MKWTADWWQRLWRKCWNCGYGVPTWAKRCPRCGVLQENEEI